MTNNIINICKLSTINYKISYVGVNNIEELDSLNKKEIRLISGMIVDKLD